MADGFLLSSLSNKWRALASDARPVGLYSMSPSDFCNVWYDHGKDENTADDLVRSRMASDDRKKRALCQNTGTDAGHQLSDGMGYAPAISCVDGS